MLLLEYFKTTLAKKIALQKKTIIIPILATRTLQGTLQPHYAWAPLMSRRQDRRHICVQFDSSPQFRYGATHLTLE